mgnify:CR=1 FL=1
MATQRQITDHITNVRTQARTIIEAISELDSLRSEWDALGLSGTLTPENFVGENEGLMGDDIAGVYTTHAALKALMAQGHATNLYKVK